MRQALLILFLALITFAASAQRGYNYYKDSSRVGSANEKAYTYFKKAYYDCIWQWTREGADSAEYYLKLAIKEDSNYSAAYAFLAHVYQFQTYDYQDLDRKFALEKKYAEKAMSLNPKTGDAYSVMSDVVWTEHDTAQALSLLRNAIAMEPDNVGNYIFLAIRFTQMGNENDSAIYYLHRLLQYDPEYGQAFMKLGNVYNWSNNNFDSAKFYYRKAILHYNTIKPRDNRMMGGYASLAQVYSKEKQYDSAVYYYKLFIREVEPTAMYTRDVTLRETYKALYECQQGLSGNSLNQFLVMNKNRIAKDSNNLDILFDVLEGNYMKVDEDSVYEKYALPLAKRLQLIHSSDPYVKIFATEDEFVILKKLKRNNQALKVLESYNAKNPKEPLILFDLGRMKIFQKDYQAGFAYLKKAKLNLNTVFTKQVFIDQLKNNDFDEVRNTPDFKKLIE
jgi:Tfp pilus assembly protein PilF